MAQHSIEFPDGETPAAEQVSSDDAADFGAIREHGPQQAVHEEGTLQLDAPAAVAQAEVGTTTPAAESAAGADPAQRDALASAANDEASAPLDTDATAPGAPAQTDEQQHAVPPAGLAQHDIPVSAAGAEPAQASESEPEGRDAATPDDNPLTDDDTDEREARRA
jgi:segregation and condensation protein B